MDGSRMIIFDQLEQALLENDPVEAIRELAIKLYINGMKKEEILKEFFAFDNMLKEKDRNSDYLEDVIDMITGYYVGRNLDFK